MKAKANVKNILICIAITVFMLVGIFAFTACDKGVPDTLEKLESELGITVDGGGFEKGSELVSTAVEATSDEGEAALAAIAEEGYNQDGEVYIFDIFVSKSGEKVQPEGKVTVTIPAPLEDMTGYIVFHIKDDGSVTKIIPTFDNGNIIFETDSFSYFVVAEAPTHVLTVGQIGSGGSISVNGDTPGSLESSPFTDEVAEFTKVTLTAHTRSEAYAFIGWFEPDTSEVTHMVLKATPVSTNTEYSFDMPENDYTVYAVFEAKVTALELDGLNAGFSANGTATYTVGDESVPHPELVVVSGVTALGNIPFEKDTDYTVDLGGLDLNVPGTYTVTYTYIKDTSIKATLTVTVVGAPDLPKTYTLSALVESDGGVIHLGGEAQPNGYFADGIEAGTEITLNAVADSGYRFVGWYTCTDVPELITSEAEHTFTVNSDTYVQARFEALVSSLALDGLNAGFSANGTANYTVGGENVPHPELVLLSGVTARGNIPLEKDTDYTVDLGGLDLNVPGTYTITYTYIENTSIKATLTVSVSPATRDVTARADSEYGVILNGTDTYTVDTPYEATLTVGTTVTLTASARNGEFIGWYIDADEGALISTDETYAFTVGGADIHVVAKFLPKLTAFRLDVSNAGFNADLGSPTVVRIGDSTLPVPENVIVYGVRADGSESLLVYGTDYEIYKDGLNLGAIGEYTVAYSSLTTYDEAAGRYIGAALEIRVLPGASAEAYGLSYEGSADPVKYNGGRAAYVFKTSIYNNGEVCDDLSKIGLKYEWRIHGTDTVVPAANDDTWSGTNYHYPSPAVVGIYDFVVYLENEEGVKTDLLTVTRTIEENKFSAVTENLVISEYTLYTVIAKVGDKYYAMPNIFDGRCEREAIEVIPDENGVISLGNNYEYVFRAYDSYKKTGADEILYRCRIGNGPNRTGNLILWSTGGIEYNTSSSADYTLTISLNEDGTLNMHSPYCWGTLSLVYDEESGKYFFTAKTTDETRSSYPVYLYAEYTEPQEESKAVYEYFGSKLTKDYDGKAVCFNMYKEVSICNEYEEDLFTMLKNESGRFAWCDLKGNVLLVGEPDEMGYVSGPADIGMYTLVWQEMTKGEFGPEWVTVAMLHDFEICDPEIG